VSSSSSSESESNDDDDTDSASSDEEEVKDAREARRDARSRRRQSVQNSCSDAQLHRGINLPVFVMCNDNNIEEIEEFLSSREYFGLSAEDVAVFRQGTMPALDATGRVILQEKHHVAMYPNGGGGIFPALLSEGLLAELKSRNIEHVFMASQDNLLLKPGDPEFLGMNAIMASQGSLKCVSRRFESEPLGLFLMRKMGMGVDVDGDGKVSKAEMMLERRQPIVLETRECHTEIRTKRNRKDRSMLLFEAASISQFYFRTRFLAKLSEKGHSRWHAIWRRQPHIELTHGRAVAPPAQCRNSVRLEMFVADVFDHLQSVIGLLVDRNTEFAYVKDLAGEYTAKQAVYSLSLLHFKWLKDSDFNFANGSSPNGLLARCEVSPLVSYQGEDIGGLCSGEEIALPFHLPSPEELQLGTDPCAKVSDVPETRPVGFRCHAIAEYVSATGVFEALEEQRLAKGMAQELERYQKFHEELDDVVCVRARSRQNQTEELCPTPEALLSDRDNWEERLRRADEEWAKEELALKLQGISMGFDDGADEKDGQEEGEDIQGPDGGKASKARKMPRYPARSNMSSKQPNGGQRKMAFRSNQPMPPFGYTTFGPGSGYRSVAVPPRLPGAKERTRGWNAARMRKGNRTELDYKKWRLDGLLAKERGDREVPMPNRHLWIHRPPAGVGTEFDHFGKHDARQWILKTGEFPTDDDGNPLGNIDPI